MSDQKFIEPLRQAGLEKYVDELLKLKRPCVRLHAEPAAEPDKLPLGSSRIGGLPDLPPNVPWPGRNGRPCEFLAQINLSEAAQYDEAGFLPKEGLLLFFFDGLSYEDKDYQHYQSGRETISYYTGDLALLKRVSEFPAQMEDWQHYRTCTIRFETDWMLPIWHSAVGLLMARKLFHYDDLTHQVPADLDTYYDVICKLEPQHDKDKHHLLGYPEPLIQDDPLYEIPGVWDDSKRELNEALVAEWIPLLQISSDDGPEMGFGDLGSVYYSIRKADLLTKNFDNALANMESY